MSILLFVLIYIFIILCISDEVQCFLNEDGTQSCEELKVMDHLSHILSTKDYECTNKQSLNKCNRWAESGECDNNLNFMIWNCAKSCGFCHLIDPKNRCKRHPDAQPAIGPGGVDAMFNRIINEFQHYKPQVISRDPWLVVLDDVFTEEECKGLIKYGGRTFQRSKDAGKMTGDEAQFEGIVSDARTSYTNWCVGNCWKKPVVQSIARKAENITMIPRQNSEFFQVLRYNVGQYYVRHHDYIFGHLDLPIGPRLYTFYIYLNDVEEGGETKFHDINGGVVVKPKRGRVAIWPSVTNDDPSKKEMRTDHEAMKVKKGVKYGANLWLHQYNFHDPYKVLCTG